MSDIVEQPAHIFALLNYQQADRDGIMVLTSRQAIHETIDEITTLRARVAELGEVLELYADDVSWALNGNCDPNGGNFCGQSFAREALGINK